MLEKRYVKAENLTTKHTSMYRTGKTAQKHKQTSGSKTSINSRMNLPIRVRQLLILSNLKFSRRNIIVFRNPCPCTFSSIVFFLLSNVFLLYYIGKRKRDVFAEGFDCLVLVFFLLSQFVFHWLLRVNCPSLHQHFWFFCVERLLWCRYFFFLRQFWTICGCFSFCTSNFLLNRPWFLYRSLFFCLLFLELYLFCMSFVKKICFVVSVNTLVSLAFWH